MVQGCAETLPFADHSFNLVFCVNAFYHFTSTQQFLHEAYRVLSPDGIVAILGKDPRREENRIWYYSYFPETRSIDMARYPSREIIQEWMTAAGFKNLSLQVAEHISDPMRGREIYRNPFLQKHAFSQLALLSEEAYQTGVRRIRTALQKAEARGETLVFEVDLVLAMLTGIKS